MLKRILTKGLYCFYQFPYNWVVYLKSNNHNKRFKLRVYDVTSNLNMKNHNYVCFVVFKSHFVKLEVLNSKKEHLHVHNMNSKKIMNMPVQTGQKIHIFNRFMTSEILNSNLIV